VSSIALYTDHTDLMDKLPPSIPDPKLHWEPIGDKGREELVAYEKYRLWEDRARGLWRWALRTWPDDGLPLPGHGARREFEHAIVDTYQDLRLRASIRGL